MRAKGPKIDHLREVAAFRSMTDKELAQLSPLLEECTVPAGATLTREGFVGRECFLVLDGQASVLVGGRQVAKIGPGEFIGEMALLAHQPRSATVLAEEPMRLLVVGPAGFPSVVASGHVLRRLAATLAQRLGQSDEWPNDISGPSTRRAAPARDGL